MRLWHKDLISVLPRQQLLGQWRECCLIAKQIAEKGTPGHILVNRIMDYPIQHFIMYSRLVFMEMYERGYKCDESKIIKWFLMIPFEPRKMTNEDIFSSWHDERYLKQCYYNLQEKADCGEISDAEWDRIKCRFGEYDL